MPLSKGPFDFKILAAFVAVVAVATVFILCRSATPTSPDTTLPRAVGTPIPRDHRGLASVGPYDHRLVADEPKRVTAINLSPQANTWTVRAVVHGWALAAAPLDSPIVTVHWVRPSGGNLVPMRSGRVDAQSTFTSFFDADKILREGAEHASKCTLQVEASLAGYKSAMKRITLGKQAVAALSSGQTHNWTTQVSISLAKTTAIMGRAVTEQGTPLPHCTVARFVRNGSSVLYQAMTTTDIRGDFDLPLSHGGESILVLFDDAHRPRTMAIRLADLESLDLGNITLERGATLSGRLRDAHNRSLSGLSVNVQYHWSQAGAEIVRLGNRHIVWLNGQFEHDSIALPLSEDSRFSAGGLVPLGIYSISASIGSGCRLAGMARQSTQRVTVPVEDLDFCLSDPRLNIRLEFKDEPVSDVRVFVSHLGENGAALAKTACYTDAEGIVRFQTPPGISVEVTATDPRWGQAMIHALTPPDGQSVLLPMALDHSSGTGAASIVAHRMSNGTPVTEAWIGFYRLDDRPESGPFFLHHARSDVGVFDIPKVPAGTWKLRIRAGDTWSDYSASSLIPESQTLTILSNQTTPLQMHLKTGGRLEILVTDAQGTVLPATCEVFDSTGRRVAVEFVASSPRGATNKNSVLVHPVLGEGVAYSRVQPALCAGAYSIALSCEGFDDTRRAVTLLENQLESLTIILDRTRTGD